MRGARGVGRGEVRIKGALRKELKCNNSCCGHAQSVLYAAFVYLLTYLPPAPYTSPSSVLRLVWCAFVKLLLSAGVAVVGFNASA